MGISLSKLWKIVKDRETWHTAVHGVARSWIPLSNWTAKTTRLLRLPRTTGRSKQSILKEINSEYSLKGLMLKLKLQYFGHLMWTADSLEKTLMLGKTEGRRRRGWQRMRCLMASPTQWIWTPRDGEGQGSLPCCSPWGCKESDVTERLNKQTKIRKGTGNHSVEFGIYLKTNGKSLVVM